MIGHFGFWPYKKSQATKTIIGKVITDTEIKLLQQQLQDYESVLQWYAKCTDGLREAPHCGQKARDILAKWRDEK